MDKYSKTYQNFMFKGDCDAEFYNLNGLTSLIKKLTFQES